MAPQIKKYTVLVRSLYDHTFFLEIDAVSQEDAIKAIESTRNQCKYSTVYSVYFIVVILAVFENPDYLTLFRKSDIGWFQFPGDIRTYLIKYVRVPLIETWAKLTLSLRKQQSGIPYIEVTREGHKITRKHLSDLEIQSKIDDIESELSVVYNLMRDSLLAWRQPPELADAWISNWRNYWLDLCK